MEITLNLKDPDNFLKRLDEPEFQEAFISTVKALIIDLKAKKLAEKQIQIIRDGGTNA